MSDMSNLGNLGEWVQDPDVPEYYGPSLIWRDVAGRYTFFYEPGMGYYILDNQLGELVLSTNGWVLFVDSEQAGWEYLGQREIDAGYFVPTPGQRYRDLQGAARVFADRKMDNNYYGSPAWQVRAQMGAYREAGEQYFFERAFTDPYWGSKLASQQLYDAGSAIGVQLVSAAVVNAQTGELAERAASANADTNFADGLMPVVLAAIAIIALQPQLVGAIANMAAGEVLVADTLLAEADSLFADYVVNLSVDISLDTVATLTDAALNEAIASELVAKSAMQSIQEFALSKAKSIAVSQLMRELPASAQTVYRAYSLGSQAYSLFGPAGGDAGDEFVGPLPADPQALFEEKAARDEQAEAAWDEYLDAQALANAEQDRLISEQWAWQAEAEAEAYRLQVAEQDARYVAEQEALARAQAQYTAEAEALAEAQAKALYEQEQFAIAQAARDAEAQARDDAAAEAYRVQVAEQDARQAAGQAQVDAQAEANALSLQEQSAIAQAQAEAEIERLYAERQRARLEADRLEAEAFALYQQEQAAIAQAESDRIEAEAFALYQQEQAALAQAEADRLALEAQTLYDQEQAALAQAEADRLAALATETARLQALADAEALARSIELARAAAEAARLAEIAYRLAHQPVIVRPGGPGPGGPGPDTIIDGPPDSAQAIAKWALLAFAVYSASKGV